MRENRSLYLAGLLGLIALLIFLGTDRIARPWIVSGRSMEPALQAGDLVIVDIWSYRQRSPREGEIVLFYGPQPARRALVKRVVKPPASGDVGSSEIWLLGDNQVISADSRHFGPVPASAVRGRIVWRYWPVSRAGPVGAFRD
jgi:nickel-type superoxide dismutase maturation protease